MSTMLDVAKKVLTAAGRGVEFILTGESNFAIITSDFKDSDKISDLVQGKRVMGEARTFLETRFSIRLQHPVLLELFAEGEWTTDNFYRMLHGTLGYYRPQPLGEQMAHGLHVMKGLPRVRFKAIVAHELTHAWEREVGILVSDRALREGFARWVEYQVLVTEGARREADRVAAIRSWRFGRGVRKLLEVEKEKGVQGVLEYVRSIR